MQFGKELSLSSLGRRRENGSTNLKSLPGKSSSVDAKTGGTLRGQRPAPFCPPVVGGQFVVSPQLERQTFIPNGIFAWRNSDYSMLRIGSLGEGS